MLIDRMFPETWQWYCRWSWRWWKYRMHGWYGCSCRRSDDVKYFFFHSGYFYNNFWVNVFPCWYKRGGYLSREDSHLFRWWVIANLSQWKPFSDWDKRSARIRSDPDRNMSVRWPGSRAKSTDVRLEYSYRYYYCIIFRHPLQSFWCLGIISVGNLKR